jgi:hypothetical protein
MPDGELGWNKANSLSVFQNCICIEVVVPQVRVDSIDCLTMSLT